LATIIELLTRAAAHLQAGEPGAAEDCCRQALAADETVSDAWYALGAVHQLRHQWAESAAVYLRALSLDPKHLGARTNLGLALLSLGKVESAKTHLGEAIRLNPEFAQAHNNLGNAHQAEGELAQAAACYRRVLELTPGSLEALDNLGNTQHAMGEMNDAVQSFERALAIAPDRPESHFFRALTWLKMGNLEDGWEEYEWRFRCNGYPVPQFHQPLWDGRRLAGRGILLYADQGLGDTIQFVRYAHLVRRRGGKVVVVCQKSLERILATCPGVEATVSEGSIVPELDFYVPISSLPRVFGTSLATIPSRAPYLSADRGLAEHWREELAGSPEFKIGVCWQGNPAHGKDRQRSFRLANLEPVVRRGGTRLFSLQKGQGAEQLRELGGRFSATDLASRLDDLMDTAAVMMNLDLVITPDTSLAHLAGALGVPAWVALPLAADWRWLSGRDDSPWYPSLRLFRQRQWGDWQGVFERMAGALERVQHPKRRSA
jgi:Tfp pilus assembly protein PilF